MRCLKPSKLNTIKLRASTRTVLRDVNRLMNYQYFCNFAKFKTPIFQPSAKNSFRKVRWVSDESSNRHIFRNANELIIYHR